MSRPDLYLRRHVCTRVLTGVPHGFHTVWKTLKNHDDNAGAPMESCDLFDQKNKCAAVLRRIGPVS